MASLKRTQPTGISLPLSAYPRLKSRGLIEARRGVRRAWRVGRGYPRLKSRGLIEAHPRVQRREVRH